MKEIIHDNSNVTANGKQVAILKKLFPECFDKRGAFIMQKMQEIVGESKIEFSQESYSLNWLGKSYARLLANENQRTLIAEDKNHNQKPENRESKNLLIEGDNLEVLKHLVNAYSEQVKMIYIDPLYNTGSDGFSYNDDRKFTVDELCRLTSIDKNEAKRILDFTQSKPNSHSAWLTFIYPRLYVAKELLSKDGVIFISIDDNEQGTLKLLCDEVFGEENLVGTIIWKNVTDNNPSKVVTEHEYILVYAKSISNIEVTWKSSLSAIRDLLVEVGEEFIKKYPDQAIREKEYKKWFSENKYQLGELDRYKYIDDGGIYTGSQSVHNPGKEGYRYDVPHDKNGKPCKQPLMGYRFPKETMNQLIADGKILFGKDHNKIIELKVYAKDYVDKLSSVIELDGRLGANELRRLFPEAKKIFTNPKPTDLIKKLVSFATGDDDLIVDFFAGSGTTAHAVMKLNAERGSNRRCINIQLAELVDEKLEAYEVGFKTIFDITKTRIQRAAALIQEEHPDYKGDLGFKMFKVFPIFDGYLDDIEKIDRQKPLFDGSKLSGEQVENLLTTWKVYDGIQLTQDLSKVLLGKYKASYCDKKLYLMDTGFTTNDLKSLIEKLDVDKDFCPAKVVLFGYNFESKHQREIKEALSTYANKKSIQVDVKVRY